jgi:hypothetical protein
MHFLKQIGSERKMMVRYTVCIIFIVAVSCSAADLNCSGLDGSETRGNFAGSPHDRLCIRKSLKEPNWLNPDRIKIFETPKLHTFKCLYYIQGCRKEGYDIFTTEDQDDVGRFRLSEALNDDLRVCDLSHFPNHTFLLCRTYESRIFELCFGDDCSHCCKLIDCREQALFKAQQGALKGTMGIQVTVKNAIAHGPVTDDSDNTNVYSSTVLSCGTIEITGSTPIPDPDSSSAEDKKEEKVAGNKDEDSNLLPLTIGIVAGGTVLGSIVIYALMLTYTKRVSDAAGSEKA